MTRPADPVVSPADTPDRARADIELLREAAEGWPTPNPYTAACDQLEMSFAALLAVGERDRRQIARLTAALTEITESRTSFGDDTIYANHAERVAYNALNHPAVLAGEEDAANGN